jgi:membrane-bound ClpP family serine protease
MSDLLPYIFGAITLAGLIYFAFSLVGGGDQSIGGFGDTDGGFGCMILAAFLSVFGVIGLLGTLSGWNLILTLVAAIAIGLLIGRLIMAILRFVMNQQTPTIVSEDLIGMIARVTIDTPAGKTGEAIMDNPHVSKFPVRETSGAELKRGDQVEVVDFSSGILYVKRKRI